MSLRKIVLVFLCAATCQTVLAADESTTGLIGIDGNQYFKAVSKLMDEKCGPFGFFSCYDGRCSCYLVLPARTNYSQASKHCQHFQGQLTTLSSQEESDFVADILKRSNVQTAWIGMSRNDSSADFEWADKSAVAYSALKKDEQKGDCVQLSSSKNWVSWACTEANSPFVCEVPFASTPVKATCRPGWAKFGNYCYQLYKDQRTWDDAQKRCKCVDANLVSVHSLEENEFIHDMMTMSNLGVTWIGFRRDSASEDFYWVDDTDTVFTHWRPNEPNNHLQTNEECGETRTRYRKWNDLPCSFKLHYTCKMKLDPDMK